MIILTFVYNIWPFVLIYKHLNWYINLNSKHFKLFLWQKTNRNTTRKRVISEGRFCRKFVGKNLLRHISDIIPQSVKNLLGNPILTKFSNRFSTVTYFQVLSDVHLFPTNFRPALFPADFQQKQFFDRNLFPTDFSTDIFFRQISVSNSVFDTIFSSTEKLSISTT